MPTTPLSLAEQLYLLSYDPTRKRFTGSGERGLLLRAAALLDSARSARHGVRPEGIAEADAAAVALAAAARLRTVVGRADAKQRKDRIEALTARTGPVPKALRKAVDSQHAATAASGG
ncbi:hypothetical protein LWC33_19805 [Pseudonocardia sp. RS11V-5]|uniref:hypothetical protein n=1 Tax=Pseudonocardia terrae TaxID=2905831 RepID=UPI001E2B35DF|nr:hypothetical protein [Pseudonocardia terrae]MCE3553690.1 hypothetical protein [Pseudonocardia terrae]